MFRYGGVPDILRTEVPQTADRPLSTLRLFFCRSRYRLEGLSTEPSYRSRTGLVKVLRPGWDGTSRQKSEERDRTQVYRSFGQ